MDNKNQEQKEKPTRQFSPYSGLYNPVGTNVDTKPANTPASIQKPSTHTTQNMPTQNIPTQAVQIAPLNTTDLLQNQYGLNLEEKAKAQGRQLNPLDTQNLSNPTTKEIFIQEETRLQNKFFRLVERNYSQILEEPQRTTYKWVRFYSSASNFVIFFSWMGMYFTNTTESQMTSRMKKLTVGFIFLYFFSNQLFYLQKYNITYKYFNQKYNGLRHNEIENKLNELKGDILEIR
jgi:hypothetical protein